MFRMTTSTQTRLVTLVLAGWIAAGCGSSSATNDPTPTGNPPVAAFTSSPVSPAAGQAVTFTDRSTGSPESWQWTFGDGSTSTVQSPAHAFTSAGTYTVTLTARNAAGTSTVSQAVLVAAPSAAPVASFYRTASAVLAGQTIGFADTSTGSPTSWSWSFGDGSTSASRNPGHAYAAAGTYTVSLTVANAGGSSVQTGAVTVGPAGPVPRFTMAQTLQDGAQRTTLAFSGLAMITGNLEAQSFFPPGKVADYTGFQYLRDNDPDDMGHNTSFLTRIANNVIYVLNDAQLAQLKSLAVAQTSQIDRYGYERFVLMKAFRKLMDGTLPAGATALDREAVKVASRDLYLIDGQISFDRAFLYAGILGSLDATQRAYLDAMKGKGWTSWPDVTDAQIRAKMQGLPQGTSVAVMTYASDLFSWYAGSLDADTYFCPERQGTYYGGFYIKDAPAIGHEGYAIDEQLTATAGRALSDANAGYVTPAQAAVMSSLVDVQRDGLYASPAVSIVGIRTEISTLLRSLLASTAQADSVREQVLALSAAYGEIDGANNHAYATVFAQVNGTLSADQRTRLMDLRHSIMSGSYSDGTPFDFTTCTTPFLYSSVIGDASVLAPYLTAADALFFPP